jgi:hypothetical protein
MKVQSSLYAHQDSGGKIESEAEGCRFTERDARRVDNTHPEFSPIKSGSMQGINDLLCMSLLHCSLKRYGCGILALHPYLRKVRLISSHHP